MIPSRPSPKQRALLERLGFESVETTESHQAVWSGARLVEGLEISLKATWEPEDIPDHGTAEQQIMRITIRAAMRLQRQQTRQRFEAVWRE